MIALPAIKAPFLNIKDFGAVSGGAALINQKAINDAIDAAAAAGGGTVIVPSGDYRSYSIRLKSKVGIHLESADSIIRAAVQGTGAGQDGGFYDAPEVNLFVGLQDQGHSHWANSLIYGIDVQDVTISGPGLIDGSYLNNGTIVNVLSGNDPSEVSTRTASGTAAGANKAIALKNATNVVFRDFRMKNGGHFAIIGTGVVGWTMDNMVVDTNRDALDVQLVAGRHHPEFGVQLAHRRCHRPEGFIRARQVLRDQECAHRKLHRKRLRRGFGARGHLLHAKTGGYRSRRPHCAHQTWHRRHDRF
ncbi:MAG: glycosyl hydrolase family 28-related protein [Rhodocyclaceae bacterium]